MGCLNIKLAHQFQAFPVTKTFSLDILSMYYLKLENLIKDKNE